MVIRPVWGKLPGGDLGKQREEVVVFLRDEFPSLPSSIVLRSRERLISYSEVEKICSFSRLVDRANEAAPIMMILGAL